MARVRAVNRRRRDYGLDSHFSFYLIAAIALGVLAGFGLGLYAAMCIIRSGPLP